MDDKNQNGNIIPRFRYPKDREKYAGKTAALPFFRKKTRIKLRRDTELKRLPLFCPKCRREVLVNVREFEIIRIAEPDAIDLLEDLGTVQNIGQKTIGEIYMQSISERIKQTLLQEYGIVTCGIHKITTGVGGDTFLINAHQGIFIYKIVDTNEMNHPEEEPEICSFLFQRGLEVSDFLKNKSGNFVTPFDDKRVGHLQKYVEGKAFAMNEAADWFMVQSPLLLGKIHNELQKYKELPMGIGAEFFRYMTPENAKKSYRHSYELAKQRGEADILNDLEFRLKIVEKISNWKFDPQKLTYCNSHGDYTVNQIICGADKINAVIDWTCACRQPVIWEITRPFFYAEPSCIDGQYDKIK